MDIGTGGRITSHGTRSEKRAPIQTVIQDCLIRQQYVVSEHGIQKGQQNVEKGNPELDTLIEKQNALLCELKKVEDRIEVLLGHNALQEVIEFPDLHVERHLSLVPPLSPDTDPAA